MRVHCQAVLAIRFVFPPFGELFFLSSSDLGAIWGRFVVLIFLIFSYHRATTLTQHDKHIVMGAYFLTFSYSVPICSYRRVTTFHSKLSEQHLAWGEMRQAKT